MTDKTKKVEKVLSEQLLRDKSKNQMKDLLKTVKKDGGDIGMKVRKSEKTKEDKMPNSIYMDNPFASSRKIETFEDFCSTARKTYESVDNDETIISTYEGFLPKDLEDLHSSRHGENIHLNDDNWVKGTKEDFERPMFKNLPDHKDRYPYDVLRSGKFIETKDGKIVAQIGTVKNKVITLDIINDENKHEWVEFDLVKLLKRVKDNELKITSNSKTKKVKIDTPWGTKFDIKENE